MSKNNKNLKKLTDQELIEELWSRIINQQINLEALLYSLQKGKLILKK